MSVFLYILRCNDGRYYVGTTRASLEERVMQHNAGAFGGFTRNRRPVELVYSQEFENAVDAIAAERQLKGWSRAKKEALISGDFDRLKSLTKRGRKAGSSLEKPAAPARHPSTRPPQ